MSRKKYGILLDTEYNPDKEIVTNFACYIIDVHGTVYESMNYLNKNALDEIRINKKKMHQFKQARIKQKVWPKIMRELQRYVNEYNVTFLVAYSIEVDIRTMYNTCKHYNTKTSFFETNNFEYIDLRKLAENHIATNNFTKYCMLKKKRLTKNGNCLCSAENIYRYISNDSFYTQEHTALADCEIELIIYKKCKQKKKKYPENAFRNRNIKKVFRRIDNKYKTVLA